MGNKLDQFLRFDIHQRIQHAMMFTSFIFCSFTGLGLKYAYSGWAQKLTKLWGGPDLMLTIHLISAALMLLCCVYHLFWLAAILSRKKTRSWAALPSPKDFIDLGDNLQYMVGLKEKPAHFAKYSYKEKFDYWAVFWGMAMIGGSGLMMWFPDISTKYVPRWFIDASQAAHSDEAVLAIVVIFFWHFYNVHFSPDFFPINKVFFKGTMTYEEMLHEHPAELERLVAKEQENNTTVYKGATPAVDSLEVIPEERISHRS
jgi:formate dehydrogenase subunit gamma